MSIPTTLSEHLCVLLLVNHYIPVHVKDNQWASISEKPLKDRMEATAKAIAFSQATKIPFDSTILLKLRPIITVIKDNNIWYPSKLYPDKMTIIKENNGIPCGGNQEQAIFIAQSLAKNSNSDFHPSIGISLEHQDVVKPQ